MNCAYDSRELHNLHTLKEAAHWHRVKFITAEQWTAIRLAYRCKLYHPNLIIRVLLFIATWIAISGANGIFFLFVSEMPETAQGMMALLGGAGAMFITDKKLCQANYHYRSGVVEALIYCASGYIVLGIGMITDWHIHLLFLSAIGVLGYVAYRYLDLIAMTFAVLTLAGFLSYESCELGGFFRQVIPFVIILSFSLVYFLARQAKRDARWMLWEDCLLVTQVLSLLLVYAGGNYLVVREGSIELMNMVLAEGEDIPFAFIFYGFTAMMPIALLYRGILLRSVMLLRLGVITLVLSVLTFRYYFSIAPPEVALTIGGAIVLGFTVWLYSYLRTVRNGFTQEKLLSRAAISNDLAAFAVSQTMGGNVQKPDESFKGGGGSFGGGGASGEF